MFTDIIQQDSLNFSGVDREFLYFGQGAEELGKKIHKAQEIRHYEITAAIANAPECMKGVINPRGIFVPILDMRIKFKFSQASYNESTVVSILHFPDLTTGIVVDRVADAVTLGSNDIPQVPRHDLTGVASYLLGIGTVDQRMLILIDIGSLLANGQALAARTLSQLKSSEGIVMNINNMKIVQELGLSFSVIIGLLHRLASLTFVCVSQLSVSIYTTSYERYSNSIPSHPINDELHEVARNTFCCCWH